MIDITQHRVNLDRINRVYTRYGSQSKIDLIMDKELIRSDIERLKNDLDRGTSNKNNRINLEQIIKYLERLHKIIDTGSSLTETPKELMHNVRRSTAMSKPSFRRNVNTTEQKPIVGQTLRLLWAWDNDELPYTIPIMLKKEPLYMLNTANYIKLSGDDRIVEMDLTDLADIIAYEFMYRDMFNTLEEIEEVLKDCSVVNYNDSSILLDFACGKDDGGKIEHPYELSKSWRVNLDDEECGTPYFSKEDKVMYDYFYTKEFNDLKYRKAVEYSCLYAINIIASSIVETASSKNVKVDVVMMDPTAITFILRNDTGKVNIREELIDNISVRAFGRKFLVKPDIQII